MTVKRLIITVFLIINTLVFYGHARELKKLTVEQALKGRLLKSLPRVLGWADDMHYYQYDRGKWSKVNAANGKTQLLHDSKNSPELVKNNFYLAAAADRTTDFNQFLFVKDKTIFLFLRQENKLVPLIKTDGDPENPTFSPDGTKIAYTLKGDLYVFELSGEQTLRLTRDGSGEILNGYASWVYYEEILGRRSRYKAFWWSPDSSRIAFMRFDQGMVPVFSLYIPDGDYGSLEQQRYPKPGYPNPEVKIGIVTIKSKQIQWIDYAGKEKSDYYLAFPTWNKKGNKLYFQWMNRDQNRLEILAYHLEKQEIQPVYEEHQQEWVEFLEDRDFYVLENDDLLIRSSKDGWFHIYYLSRKGTQRQLSKGDWSVTGIQCINEKTKHIYFTAAKEDSTGNDFFKIDYAGKGIKKLTDFKGMHRLEVSPTGRYFVDSYSAVNTPPRVELRDNRGKLVRKPGDSYSPEMDTYQLAKGELFKIKTDDGIELPALWYLPPDFDKTKKYPVLIGVYGGPGSSIVRNLYSRNLEEYYLAQEGIICLTVDHRGSGHFGKKGMVMMYRQLGKWEMHDYIQVVKYLRTLPFIDSEKIGIRGNSYGGYAAALAMTYGADYFKYGLAASSVIDWKLYDSVYTERYMDTPQDNPEGYKNSSVLTYIDQFKGVLRITHGTMDDNVHVQNTLQFVDKLLDTGKTVELMLYPGERHGIGDKKWEENNKSDLNFWLKHFLGRSIKY